MCVCVTKKKSARRMASTTSDTGDTSSKQQQAQRKENYFFFYLCVCVCVCTCMHAHVQYMCLPVCPSGDHLPMPTRWRRNSTSSLHRCGCILPTNLPNACFGSNIHMHISIQKWVIIFVCTWATMCVQIVDTLVFVVSKHRHS